MTEECPSRHAVPGRRPPAGLGAALLLLAWIPGAMAAPQSHQITIDGMRFQPDALVVQQGDRVTWVNKDLVPHTVTERRFDSAAIKPAGSWTFVPRKPGTYNYVCTFHPTMKGMLVVQEKRVRHDQSRTGRPDSGSGR